MRQKLTIGIAVLAIVAVIFFMVKDMFQEPKVSSNPFEYSIEAYTDIESDEFCYEEVNRAIIDIDELKGISIGRDDNIYLSGTNKILVYNNMQVLIKEFAINGSAENINVASNGNIFLGMKDHIEVLNSEGKLIASWDAYNSKTVITSIAVTENEVFLADAGNKLIFKYDLEGNFLESFGAKDTLSNRPGFIIPSPYFDIAIGREEQLWAVNSGMHSFEAYDDKGKLLSSWKKTSMRLDGFSGCCNPTHFSMLSDGSFVSSEKGLVRVKIHSPDGNYKCVVAGPAEFDEKEKGIDIAVNLNDDIFLIVPSKKELRKYKRKSI